MLKGLFINKIFGLVVSVWVRLICCCMLLDSLWVYFVFYVLSFMMLRKDVVCCMCLFLGMFWIFSGMVILFRIEWCGIRVKF